MQFWGRSWWGGSRSPRQQGLSPSHYDCTAAITSGHAWTDGQQVSEAVARTSPHGPHHSLRTCGGCGEIISFPPMVFIKNIRADERTSALAQQLPNYENFFNTGGLCRAVVARRDECVGRGELPGTRQLRKPGTAPRRNEGEAVLPTDPPLRCK